jgi:hypothetical protein
MRRFFLSAAAVLLFGSVPVAQTTPANPPVEGEPARKQAKRHHPHIAERHTSHPAERHKPHSATKHKAHDAPHHPKPKAKSHKKTKPDANGLPPA